jgi:uncharacterized protein YbjT (DUF2867 family)
VTVLVTGATGTLGRPLVDQLRTAGLNVRAMSRHGAVRADLRTGEGLADAVHGAGVVIHAATSPLTDLKATDVDGTGRLLDAAAKAGGVRHLVYVSIVGIDRAQAYLYYRAKLAAEALIREGRMPWTILRATQFHNLMPERFFPLMGRFGVLPLDPRWQIQPVEVTEVAARLVDIAAAPASGLLPDFGGPEVMTWLEMARRWKRASRSRRLIMPMPVPGALSRQFRDALICPDHRDGKVPFDDWLQRRYREQPS